MNIYITDELYTSAFNIAFFFLKCKSRSCEVGSVGKWTCCEDLSSNLSDLSKKPGVLGYMLIISGLGCWIREAYIVETTGNQRFNKFSRE